MGFQTNGSLDLWVFGPMGCQTYELLGPMIHTHRTNGPSDHRHCTIQTFNNTTKNEEPKQYQFQIVELRRNLFKNCNRDSLNTIYNI